MSEFLICHVHLVLRPIVNLAIQLQLRLSLIHIFSRSIILVIHAHKITLHLRVSVFHNFEAQFKTGDVSSIFNTFL